MTAPAPLCYVFRCVLPADHHGPHQQAHGRYFGTMHHGSCEGCILDVITMLEKVEATGNPLPESIAESRLRSGVWTPADVKAWATRRLADQRAELELLRRRNKP